MPIIDIQVVGDVSPEARAGLASRLANRCGEALGSGPMQTWVRLAFLPREQYSENCGGPADGVLPVFVSLLQFAVPEGAARHDLAGSLTKAIAGCCDRPVENVHLLFQPPGKGRVAFGGKLFE